jgi:hypothetical protein
VEHHIEALTPVVFHALRRADHCRDKPLDPTHFSAQENVNV